MKKVVCALAVSAVLSNAAIADRAPNCTYEAPGTRNVALSVTIPDTIEEADFATKCLQNHVGRWSDRTVEFVDVVSIDAGRRAVAELDSNLSIVGLSQPTSKGKLTVLATAYWPNGTSPAPVESGIEADWKTLGHMALGSTSTEFNGTTSSRIIFETMGAKALDQANGEGIQHFILYEVYCQ